MSTQFSTISAQRLQRERKRGRYTALIDVRSAAEYRAGHIPGAHLIPIEEPASGWSWRWTR